MNGFFRIWECRMLVSLSDGRNAHKDSTFINTSNSAFLSKYIIEAWFSIEAFCQATKTDNYQFYLSKIWSIYKSIYLFKMYNWKGHFPSDSFYKCWKHLEKSAKKEIILQLNYMT